MATIYYFKQQKKKLQKKEQSPGAGEGRVIFFSALSALSRFVKRFLFAGFCSPPGKKNSQPSGAVSE
jgi:hypothetical protein